MKHTARNFALLALSTTLSLSSIAQGMQGGPGMKPGEMDESKMMEMRQKMMSMHDHSAGSNPVGEPGEAANVVRTVRVTMNDKFRYSPSKVAVKQGQTIRFIVKNAGKAKHEMVLGTAQYIAEHNALMQKNPEMEHEEPHMISLEPGAKGEIIWKFTQPGQFMFACLEPGHLDAGMKGVITVSKAASNSKNASSVDHSAHKH